jgi:site-specific DNA recombinase
MAEARSFSVLLVYKFDRLARQIVYAVTAVNELSEQFGVVIRSVTEPIDTATPMGRTIFAVLAGMAEQERQAITERTWGGRREKARKGGFAGGPAPIGYRRDREGGLAIVDIEAEIVRRIFEERKAGRTLQAIADGLNADSLPTKRGSRWYPAGIATVLDNPKYQGNVEYLFRWNGAETHVLKRGKHKAIVKG